MTQLDSGPTPTPPTVAPPTRPTSLRRSNDDRMVAGVCGGLGRYFGVDPIWFRLAFVVLLLGGGSGVLVYAVCWIVIPEEGGGEASTGAAPTGNRSAIAGLILVGLGVVLFFDSVFPWFDKITMPVLLVAIGAGLVIGGRVR